MPRIFYLDRLWLGRWLPFLVMGLFLLGPAVPAGLAQGAGGSTASSTGGEKPAGDWVSTFSLVARDPATGELGVVVASKYLAVGSAVPFADASLGAVATQSHVNVEFGPKGLALLAKGVEPAKAIEDLLAKDEGKELRQLGIIDGKNPPAAFTGSKCIPWAGHKLGKDFAAQGNLLAGPQVVDDMAKAFEETKGSLARRLFAGLKAGDAAGGDKRGRQSAAILVVRKKGGPNGFGDRWIDLRVDDHAEPVKELERLLKLSRKLGKEPE